jgi:dTDP-glucose 4,6-dehydratase
VDDHASGIDSVLRWGTPGESYNLGGENERENIEVVRRILEMLHKPASLIRHVPDRPGHDRRYALDSSKAQALGWRPSRPFEQALAETVAWYVDHQDWWRPLKGGEFQRYYREQYEGRLQASQGERPA